jgi:hypothetical protein
LGIVANPVAPVALTTEVLHSVENLRAAPVHSSTPQVEAAPLGPVIALAEVEVVAEDGVMAVAATFATEIEIETATFEIQEIVSATFEIREMDRRSGAMLIATMVVAETVSSILDPIASVSVEVAPVRRHATSVI